MSGDLTEKNKKKMITIAVLGLILFLVDIFAGITANNINIVSKGNKLYMIRPEMGATTGHLTLNAKVKSSDGVAFEKKYNVSLEAYSNEKKTSKSNAPTKSISAREQAEYELRSVTSSFNNKLNKKRILLPTKLKSGATIKWTRVKSTNSVLILMLTAVALILTYCNRFAIVKKQREREKASVLKQLPEFVNRLVLLLNAGLVLNAAFEKSVEETIEFNINEGDYFYDNMLGIYNSMQKANGSLDNEFREFAKSSGVRELMRIANILSDNINKGVELNKKLENESEMLWMFRKKKCEELGRLAETKLTLPLVMFLMVLIVITIAPALLEL